MEIVGQPDNSTRRPKSTRVYLRTPDGIDHSFLWFQNNKPNELLLGLYGMSAKTARMQYQWDEREVGDDGLLQRYYFDEKIAVGIPIDHVTCHADGRFHLKAKHAARPLYVHAMKRTLPLGPDTGVFLEFAAMTDRAERYGQSERSKQPCLICPCPSDNGIVLLGWFAGANYDLDGEIREALSSHIETYNPVRLQVGSFRAILAFIINPVDPAAYEKRPKGTLLTFKFPVANQRWRLKAFQFD